MGVDVGVAVTLDVGVGVGEAGSGVGVAASGITVFRIAPIHPAFASVAATITTAMSISIALLLVIFGTSLYVYAAFLLSD